MLIAGDKAPSFTLPSVDGSGDVTDPWTEGETVLAFFKVSCPVCKMVAPMLTKLAEGGARVVAVGEDPPDDDHRVQRGPGPAGAQRSPSPRRTTCPRPTGWRPFPACSWSAPDGEILEAIAGWNRDVWNALAARLGLTEPLSTPDDGLRPFRPG